MIEQLVQIYGYLHGMWRYRWSALVITWVLAIIGWVFVYTMPNQYSADAVVFVDTTSIMKPLLKGLAPETNADDELNVMTRTLLSRENLMTVIRETDMDLDITDDHAKERMLANLAGNITIKGGGGKRWDRDKNIYEISYIGRSADQVYQVVSNLLNTMIENTLSSSRTDTVSAQKFLDVQIKEYEQRLATAEQKLAEFKKSNVGFMPDEKGSYYTRLQRALDSVTSTTSALRLAEQRYAELRSQLKGESSVAVGSDDSTVAMKLSQYQLQLDELLNQYTDKHPDVLAVRQNIADLQARANSPDGAGFSTGNNTLNPVYQNLKAAVNEASIQVQLLKTELEEQQGYVKKLKESVDIIPEVEAELSKLNRDYKVTTERYLDLVERRESARLAQNIGQSTSDVTFRVIEPPIVPTSPSGPNRPLYLVMVLLAAFAAGLGWSGFRYLLQPSFVSRKQIQQKLGVPVLGTVSLYLSDEHKKQRKIQLASFLSASILLILVFSGVLFMRNV